MSIQELIDFLVRCADAEKYDISEELYDLCFRAASWVDSMLDLEGHYCD